MASSPQPSNIHEGAESAEADENPTVQPASAEDRKTAAALSALEARGGEDDDEKKSKDVDTDALGKAMKNLEVKGEGKQEVKKEEKKIKIDAADVGLLVSASSNGAWLELQPSSLEGLGSIWRLTLDS